MSPDEIGWAVGPVRPSTVLTAMIASPAQTKPKARLNLAERAGRDARSAASVAGFAK